MAGLYDWATSGIRRLDPETAHTFTIKALKYGAGPRYADRNPPSLEVNALGLTFSNPVGLAAGFDKNAEVPGAMIRLGFGFVEVGSVIPRPQKGNPKPRLFRLEADRAVINRMGFNSDGMGKIGRRLRRLRRKGFPGIVGINLGANKDSVDRAADYLVGLQALAAYGDYFVVNISSPNTPGLRDLQEGESLEDLLARLRDARRELKAKPPLLLKIAPDLTDSQAETIARLVLDYGIDGVVIGNTTTARPETLVSSHKGEGGGLSGRPLFEPSTALLRKMYQLIQGKAPLVGVGGISSGEDAYRKIRAGATLVQLYTGLVYEGPGLVRTIKRDLAACLERDGFASVKDAIGVDSR
jgi:dihydroorotate dehydrogenase